MMQQNQVWIELPKPRDAAHAAQLCELANRMMSRLRRGVSGVEFAEFSWNERHHAYEYGTPMGTEILSDRGKWFSLDYLGRE